MPTRSEYADRMRRALQVVDPDIDTSIGSIPRKIIDVVAEMLEEVSVDAYLADYAYDIDAKAGAALDDLVRLFGFSRLPAKRASGTVTLYRAANSTSTIIIPVGSQFSTDTVPPVVVATAVPAVFTPGDTSITVPAQAVEAGVAGNILARSLKRMSSPMTGLSSFANLVAFTGGADAESDDALRSRFKRTVFRNLAGTEPMFLGVALEHPQVINANVIGAVKRFRETLQFIDNAGSVEAVSSIRNAAYIYPPTGYQGDVFVGRDIDGGDVFSTSDYTFDPTNLVSSTYRPKISGPLSSTWTPGIYEVEFAYLPTMSRNQPNAPQAAVVNRIDVWVQGTKITAATESFSTRTTSTDRFTGSSSDVLYRNKFARFDGTTPTLGNLFFPLSYSPVLDASSDDTLVINGITYYEGLDYWMVNCITADGMAPHSLAGLEWLSTGNGAGAGGRPVQPGVAYSGTADGTSDATHIQKPGAGWTVNAYANAQVVITSGTGAGQTRTITSNTATALTVGAAFSPAPDGTSVFEIIRRDPVTVTYAYNSVPMDIERSLQNWRLITSDVWVHQAFSILLNLNFHVVLNDGATLSQVKADMRTAIENHLETVGFDNVLQASDLLAIAHATPGVDSIRWTSRQDSLTASGTATSGGASTLTLTGAGWDTHPNSGLGVYAGRQVNITAGTGSGQSRVIYSHTADTITVVDPWTVVPDATSQFTIVPFYGIQRVNAAGYVTNTDEFATKSYSDKADSFRVTDVWTDDASVVELNDIWLTQTAFNAFGTM